MTTHPVQYDTPKNRKTETRSNRNDWWHECWRSDRLDGVGWAAIFIWAALVVAADSTSFQSNFGWWDGWGVFFAGAGVIVLAETVLRLLMPVYRARWSWTFIVGSVLLAIGLGTWESLEWVWALVLTAIGIAILRNAILRRRGSDGGGPDVRD
jgi:hypothetical protein